MKIAFISAGVISGMDLRYELEIAIANLAIEASFDNYIIADVLSGTISVYAVTIGSGDPEIESTAIFLAKLTTDATSVTAIDLSIAPRRAISGTKLVKDSVSATEITTLMEYSQNMSFNGAFATFTWWASAASG